MKIRHSNSLILILLIILAGSFSGCISDLPPDEAAYKTTVNEIKNTLEPYGKIQIRSESKESHDKKSGRNLIITELNREDVKKRESYYYENKSKWVLHEESLKNITTTFPDSIWADDAAFVRSLIYLITNHPFKALVPQRTATYQRFLETYSTVHLEPWTKSKFKDWFTYAFELSPEESPSTEESKIRGRLYLALIAEYGQVGNIQKAEIVLKQLEKESLQDPMYSESGREMLKYYRN